MFTLFAYSENYTAAATADEILPVPDQHLRVEGNNVIIPAGMNNLLGAALISSVGTFFQVNSPSLRRTVLLDIPTICTDTEPLYPFPWQDMFYNPIPLDEFEPIRAVASVSAAGRATALLWIGDGPQAAVTGEIYTVRATSATTLSPYAWTNGALTFSQVLPAGSYQVVGMHATSATLIAARLVFVGGTWRPGCPGTDLPVDTGVNVFRRGNSGIWGEFRHDQPPTVDFLATGADTAETVWLDIIKVA